MKKQVKKMKKQTIKKTKKRDTKVFFLSDTHFPYQSKSAIKKLLKLIEKEQPTHVIQAGDLLDMYSFSKYDRTLDLTTPADEIERGLAEASKMWADIRKIVPSAKCIQLIGNHEDRIKKRIIEKMPELLSLYDPITSLYKFDGVKVLASSKDHYELQGVIYVHGHYTKLGDHAKFFRKNVVHGHTHRVGIFYEKIADGLIWELDCGHMADATSLPLSYTQSKFSKWTMAVGIITNGQPQLIILE